MRVAEKYETGWPVHASRACKEVKEEQMANTIDQNLDVLASSPEEINQIAERLKQPSAELVNSLAQRFCEPASEVARFLAELLEVESVENLGYVDPSVNKSRRFSFAFADRYWGIFHSHLLEVSGAFPDAIFLLESFDMQWSYSVRQVIHSGEVVQTIRDDDQKAQAMNWMLLDIFAPFRAEYEDGLPFGSLWSQWVDGLIAAAQELKARGEPG
jgi:hypothetical protein